MRPRLAPSPQVGNVSGVWSCRLGKAPNPLHDRATQGLSNITALRTALRTQVPASPCPARMVLAERIARAVPGPKSPHQSTQQILAARTVCPGPHTRFKQRLAGLPNPSDTCASPACLSSTGSCNNCQRKATQATPASLCLTDAAKRCSGLDHGRAQQVLLGLRVPFVLLSRGTWSVFSWATDPGACTSCPCRISSGSS